MSPRTPVDGAAHDALLADDLVKTYPSGRGKPRVRALDGLCIQVRAGSVHALLGPNGAGKSTTVKILATLARADSGRAVVAGIDVARHPDAVRRSIGVVGQRGSADPMATTRENLVLAARIQGLGRREAAARAVELLDRFDLLDVADRRAMTLSGGLNRRLDVAIGLVHRPTVLFLDEPTTGLDPEVRVRLWAEIERLRAQDRMTVLLTTHYLDEADRLADRVSIIDHGRVVVEGSPEELKSELDGDTVVVELESPTAAESAAARVTRSAGHAADGLADVQVHGATLRARVTRGPRAVSGVLVAVEEAGLTVVRVSVARPTLDDVYLRHVGRHFEVAA